MIHKFELIKVLIDATEPALGSRKKYGYPRDVEIDSGTGGSYKRNIDPIAERIVEILRPTKDDDVVSYEDLRGFQRELIYRHVLFDEPYKSQMPVIVGLLDLTKELIDNGYRALADEHWKEAIALLKELVNTSTYYIPEEKRELRDAYPKEYDTANCVLKLMKQYSWKVSIDASNNIFIEKGVETTTKQIELWVKSIGGITLIERIFDFLGASRFYNELMLRYLVGRSTSMTAFEHKPDIPIGYLLNIAVKYPYKKESERTNEILSQIFDTSAQLCNALFQSQHYSILEFLFSSGLQLRKLSTDISVYDSVYSFPQGDIPTEIETIKGLLDFVSPADFLKHCGFSLESLIKLMEYIYAQCKCAHLPITVHKSTASKSLEIPKGESKPLFELLSHQPNAINTKYVVPSDLSGTNFWHKPLIEINSNTYYLINKTWCAKAFYECISVKLRSISNFDNSVGLSIESYLKYKCREKGITYSAGKYEQSGIFGECDLVIETDSTIILFEIKKKILTYRAQSGSDVDILIDLASSLLDSQIQASRTELLLLEHGSIRLNDEVENRSHVLSLKGRKVERVSISHFDFRGFHDRLFLTNFLSTLLTYIVVPLSEDKEVKKKFDKLNEKAKVLRQQYQEYLKYNNDHGTSPFFDSSFHNIDHILLMLKLSVDNESFLKYFKGTKFVNTTGSLNFYKEFLFTIKRYNP